MTALARFVTGRRTKFLVPVLWLLLVAVMAPLGGKLQDEVTDDTESFLPESAESTEVVRLLGDRFENGQTANAIVIYRREGGLTRGGQAQDRGRRRAAQRASCRVIGEPAMPFGANVTAGAGVRGRLARLHGRSRSRTTSRSSATRARSCATSPRENKRGLEVYVTGDAGVLADFEEVFGEVDTKLLLGHGAARPDPARGDLPLAADRLHPAARGRRSRTRSPAGSSTCTPRAARP